MVRTLSLDLSGESWLANWKRDCGISLVEFPRFSLVDISAGKMECPMGNFQKFPSRPRGVSEQKTRQKPGEKKGAENYLPYTYVTSYKVISDDVISGHFRWCNFRSGHSYSRSSSNTSPIQYDILLIVLFYRILNKIYPILMSKKHLSRYGRIIFVI